VFAYAAHAVSMRIVAYPEAGVPLELRLQVVALQDEAWPGTAPSGPEPWHDPALSPLSMLLVRDRVVLSALDILSKELEHAGHRFAASGLSAVVTGRANQGRGYGSRLVAAAREQIERSGSDLGIFTCDRHLQAFYERAGWEVLPGTVLVGGTREAPFPSDQFDKVTMARFFTPRASTLAGTFVGSRIPLYPGDIDKLW
jgi:GNAT superfamily N-acetyltransferase